MTTPTTEPTVLYTGDTWAWTKTEADYAAGSGWTLKYVLANAAERIAITAAASGDDHAVTVAAATTATYAAGAYTWQRYVENGSGARHTLGSGSVTIRAGLHATTGGSDMRSAAQKALDQAVEAMAEYTATQGVVSEYEIDGRRMKFRSVDELRKLVGYWSQAVQAEKDAEATRLGQSTSRKIFTRFGQ